MIAQNPTPSMIADRLVAEMGRDAALATAHSAFEQLKGSKSGVLPAQVDRLLSLIDALKSVPEAPSPSGVPRG